MRTAGERAGLTTKGRARLVLIVDQLEEIFTIEPAGEPQRERFIAALEALAHSGAVWVVATMRSDFFDRLETTPRLLALSAGEARYVLAPPSGAEILQMVREPAREAGLVYAFDAERGVGLDEIIHEEAARDPAALPLLSFLLDQLWRRRSATGELTLEAYRELGGLAGALGRRAEEVFAAQTPAVQAELPALLRTLARVGPGGKISARSAPLSQTMACRRRASRGRRVRSNRRCAARRRHRSTCRCRHGRARRRVCPCSGWSTAGRAPSRSIRTATSRWPTARWT